MARVANNYEINVAKKSFPSDEYGIHYCCIEIPETGVREARQKLAEIREIFGKEYNVNMTYWDCRGIDVESREVR